MKNKKYLPKDVCFGEMVINAGREGYYTMPVSPFIKINDEQGLVGYMKPKGNCIYPEYTQDTPFLTTVARVVNLTNFMEEYKKNKPVSLTMINMYLLKYKIINAFKIKQKNKVTEDGQKTLVHYRDI